jgi:mannose-6-phosphate isomerase-like protein (cupin superfamily)
MPRFCFLIPTIFISLLSYAQFNVEKLEPDSSNYENIYVKKVGEDNLQSTYVIWVKKEVKSHYHAHHTEVVFVFSGKGLMSLDGKEQKIKRGSTVRIPSGSVHSVITTSKKPLKVLSVQSPKFDGDRIWVK